MDESTRLIFEQLGISLLMGMLVGLQRQHSESLMAGLRTFPLISVLGTLAATFDKTRESGGWMVPCGFFGLVAIVAVSKTYVLVSPLDVLNPFEIWTMVVLMVGISLGGYLTYKFLGLRAGILLGGLLGGAISSTATTVSYARRSREGRNLPGPILPRPSERGQVWHA